MYKERETGFAVEGNLFDACEKNPQFNSLLKLLSENVDTLSCVDKELLSEYEQIQSQLKHNKQAFMEASVVQEEINWLVNNSRNLEDAKESILKMEDLRRQVECSFMANISPNESDESRVDKSHLLLGLDSKSFFPAKNDPKYASNVSLSKPQIYPFTVLLFAASQDSSAQIDSKA